MSQLKNRGWLAVLTAVCCAILFFSSVWGNLAAASSNTANPLGYGFNVAAWEIPLIQDMGFNWMKVFNPPGSRLPVQVLLRVDAHAADMGNLAGYGAGLRALALEQAGYVDAYEIGNEPNLDAAYGWAAPPNAADYAALLCIAYANIKDADPQAKVISAGLAPTGRVQGNWNGHPGHNGSYQDEREFFLEFLAAGGGNCLDGVGYHPYGFSADFDAVPDVPSADPTQNCANGFCFRGAEMLHELMAAHGLAAKTMWATEFGWLVTPPDYCLSDGSWDGRLWQLVTEEKQASNLVGAFQYAAANWPWMETMVVFNLNFNTAPYYNECEHMRYYAVRHRPAEQALRDMPKVVPQGELVVRPATVVLAIGAAEQPFTATIPLQLSNEGTLAFTYTAVVTSPPPLGLTLINHTGLLPPGEAAAAALVLGVNAQPPGVLTGTLTVTAVPTTTLGTPAHVPITLYIFAEIHRVYLPLVLQAENAAQ